MEKKGERKMKKLFTFGLCVLLALSMALSSCDFAGLFDGEIGRASCRERV